ncbi:MAG: hypothetical protein BWY85_01123 [Firmicutes bacterium ADurb.Bin506]|jgi:hypothetical protein|nr:MAG: hypothetical protein BWY85_01123 [Firmicutes bacterium ADurb.Bin506]
MIIEGTRIRISEGEIRDAVTALTRNGDVQLRELRLLEGGIYLDAAVRSPMVLNPRLQLEPMGVYRSHLRFRVSGQLGLGPLSIDMALGMMSSRFPPGVAYMGSSTVDVDLEVAGTGVLSAVDLAGITVSPGELLLDVNRVAVSSLAIVNWLANKDDIAGGLH